MLRRQKQTIVTLLVANPPIIDLSANNVDNRNNKKPNQKVSSGPIIVLTSTSTPKKR